MKPCPHLEVDVTESAPSSEPNLELKPKPFYMKPNRDILPENTGTRITRYLQCKSSSHFPKCSKLIFSVPVNFLSTHGKTFTRNQLGHICGPHC